MILELLIVALIAGVKNGIEDALDEAAHKKASSRSRYETAAERQSRERAAREDLKATMPTKSGGGWC